VVAAFAALAVVVLLAGCSSLIPPSPSPSSSASATTLPLGSSTQRLTSGGIERDYRVFVPSSLPAKPALVVMLHGGFGSADQAEKDYGWDAEASKEHFVVVYPDGTNHAWNVGGGCCGQPGVNNVNDVAFISSVVKQVSARLPIDQQRIYATGISNGGMMAYRLACDTDIFAAIGPDSATLLGDCPSPQPTSVLHIHGLADQSLPFDGGTGGGREHITGPPIESVVQTWRTADDCPPPTATTRGLVTYSTAECPSGRTVELITIEDAGHQWPGAAPKPARQKLLGTDPPSTALNATATFWAFFESHALAHPAP
jgi:polyhydroxybutyrate depolymerase